jgi:competence CoiA-like predicted nuclease
MPIKFDPDVCAKSTESIQVEMVYHLSTEEIIEVKKWLSTKTEGEIHKLRPKIRRKVNDAQFVCFCCGHEVLLRKHEQGGHFFAHKEKNIAEKSNCLYQQKGLISIDDLNRIRYHGQREGIRHKKTKEIIVRILNADRRFLGIEIEKVWTSFSDGWRKPDVAAIWDGQKIVFEAQVSNTYPQVVAERTEFYKSQGALLIWIFDTVTDSEWRTLHSDVFSSNDYQIFTVDDECVNISEETGIAHFKIYSKYSDVCPCKRDIDNRWILKETKVEDISLVPFDSINLNLDLQQATFFDQDKKQKTSRHKIICAEAQADLSYGSTEKSIQDLINSDKPIDIETVKGWAALICGIESKRLNSHP